MIYFWISLSVILIIVGLFLITQGGDRIGGSLAVLGLAIGLTLAVCSTVHSRERITASEAAATARQAANPVALMNRTI